MKQIHSSRGFTLIELLVVMGIFVFLTSFIAPSLFSTQHRASITSVVDTLSSDIKSQQEKAMSGGGVTGGSTSSSYGISFSSDHYTMFRGSTSVNNATDENVPVDVVSLSTNPANTPLVFNELTGEIGSQYQVTIQSTADSQKKTITINKFGVITGVN